MDRSALAAETCELLRALIRNRCVNDGTDGSGGESRSADLLRDYLEGCGADVELHERLPGRANLVARLPGTLPGSPSLAFMGHTDVVPVNEATWSRDPFDAEVVDGLVWGRGAVDMLNVTAAQAVAFRQLAANGFRPAGDLVYLAVADEEAGGAHGAAWLLDEMPEHVRTDYLLTEVAMLPMPTPAGPRFLLGAAEKGPFWKTIRVRGTPGHGSAPYGADNAVVTIAEIATRLAAHKPAARVTEIWQRFVAGLGLPAAQAAALTDPASLDRAIAGMAAEAPGLARTVHACTHLTISPNVVSGGTKVNMIADAASLTVDIRALPGDTAADVDAVLREALADLYDRVEITDQGVATEASESPLDTPLWDAIVAATRTIRPEGEVVPAMHTVTTDARFFRRHGTVCYGYGIFDDAMDFTTFQGMFHGNDERVSVASLGLCADFFTQVPARLWA